jgi:NAD(P)-dependent dehydrogenase (short-subunit alcohol dehydrogenase family)
MTGRTLSGRRVLVVGASSGIGSATAVAAAKAGATVVIAARRLERLTTLAGSVAGQLFPVRCDVRNADDCRRLVEQTVSVAGGLDDVVYAAAVSDMAAVKETSADEWRRILDTNVVGFSLVFAAAEAHLRQATGSLIVLSSISVLRPKPGLVPYAASKAAVHKLVEGMRTENPDISFTIVTIGPTAGGEMSRGFDPQLAAEFTDQWVREAFLARGQMTAEDVGDRIVECLGYPMRTEELVLLPRP